CSSAAIVRCHRRRASLRCSAPLCKKKDSAASAISGFRSLRPLCSRFLRAPRLLRQRYHLRMRRTPILAALCVVCVARAQTPPQRFSLEEATIADLQQRMQSGTETSRSIVEQYIARIEAVDRSGPALHSVLEVNPDALAIADRLDAERRGGRTRGPLHGIPILLKDNIATADHMMTSAGSLALAGVTPPQDAVIVAPLRDAGAVI